MKRAGSLQRRSKCRSTGMFRVVFVPVSPESRQALDRTLPRPVSDLGDLSQYCPSFELLTGTDLSLILMAKTASVPVVPVFLSEKLYKVVQTSIPLCAMQKSFGEKTETTGIDREIPP